MLILVTGVGARRTEAALRWLFDNANPSLVVAAGFAGALRPDLSPGDVLTFADVRDEGGQTWQCAEPAPTPAARLLTTPHLIASPSEKRSLAARFNANAVDMESATAARVCHERDTPFACVRAISDSADTELTPRLVRLLSGGRVSPWKLAATLASSPGLVPELVRLGRDTKRAAKNLATALRALLDQPAAAATAATPRSR